MKIHNSIHSHSVRRLLLIVPVICSMALSNLNAKILAGASDEEIEKARQELIEAQKAQQQATEQNTNIQASPKAAVDNLNTTIQQTAQMLTNMSGGYGASTPCGDFGASKTGVTYFGPAVDPPGSKYYDWNSCHHIGAYCQHLDNKSVAMSPEHAAKWYPGLHPGEWFASKYDGKRGRWDDKIGLLNSDREDRFRDGTTMNTTVNVSHSRSG